MYRFLTIALWVTLPCLLLFPKSYKQSEYQNSHSRDTALFNHYLETAISFSNRNSDSMHFYSRKAFSLAKTLHYSRGLSEYYHFLTADYNEHSLYDSALQTAQKELYWARQSGDTTRMAWGFNALANVYEYMGSIDSSIVYFIKALEILPKLKDEKLYGTLNYNLASSLYLNGDYEAALEYAKKGYTVGKSIRNTHMIANSLLDMGSIHVGLMHYDSALQYFEKVIRMVRNTSDSLSILNALNNEGDLLAKEKQYLLSLSKYKKMLRLALRDHQDYYLLYAYGNLGITQFQIKKYDLAEANLKKAISIALKINSRNELRQFYGSLSEVKEAQKKFANALDYRKKFDSLNNLLMSESSKRNMHQLEVKYQTLQKDKRITEQNLILSQNQHSIERKNRWIISTLAGFLLLLVILLFSIRSYKHKKKLQEQSFLTLQKQQEVNTLHAKMEAREEERDRIGKEMHDDIGSALTTILYLSNDLETHPIDTQRSVAGRIAHLSKTVVDKMNEIIWSMNRQYDTLDDLMAYSRQHAAQFLENHGIDYHFNTPELIPEIHLHGEQRRNIYLVIKEALHNVVKHACATQVGILFQLNKNLTITIRDNGKGLNKEELQRFGNGLRNMKQRMEAVGGSFKILVDQGTKIILKCPLDHPDQV